MEYEKKGLKKRFSDWYSNSKDGYFADFMDGYVRGLDGPMSLGETIYRRYKYGENMGNYEPISNGLKRQKSRMDRNRSKGEWSVKKGAKREALNAAGQIGGWLTGSATFGIPWAGNAAINGARMLKRKMKKEKI